VLREFWKTLQDARDEGDWIGHLVAWFQVFMGLVVIEDRGRMLQ
jgi:hypothetical protein